KNIILKFVMINSKKLPDKYIIKRNTLKVYEGTNTNFNDSGLKSGTTYNYTFEAWSKGKLLDTATHSATTSAILIQQIGINSSVQSDKKMLISWINQYIV
ncbi:hypothetical protein, partial [Neobacillus citreus]|nr:hypothetical protein [Neobacillus citreus]